MTTKQDGGFPPVSRRHYSTGSSQIPTDLLQSINPYPLDYPLETPNNHFFTNFSFDAPIPIPEPRPRSMSSSRLPPTRKPRPAQRKTSMSESHSDLFANSWSSVPSLVPGSYEEEFSPITPAQPLLGLSDDSYKKQRRRECHNQVEKRRREHINSRIEELSVLLPAHYKIYEEAIDDEEEEDEKKRVC